MQKKKSGKDITSSDILLTLQTENSGTVKLKVKKSSLIQEMSESQIANIQQSYQIPPKCATVEVLQLFEKYITKQNLNIYRERRTETDLLIGTLRLADYLALTIFQQTFISQVVITSINLLNCIAFLEETHKKLKNQENGSQCWYSLLNACITFLAQNLSEAYNSSQDKIKGLHEKILNEILDRAIRNGNTDQEIIFQLIMKSKKANSVHQLCELLRKSIVNKKINSKIHAKLSWKLQDVLNITEKKTKVFKFLEYDWMLVASRSENNDLKVNLVFCGMSKKEIGSFYIKLMWWLDGKVESKKQEEMRINYLLMNLKHELGVMTITEAQQKQLAKSKIQLSIFCCMDQLYTFTLNYISKNSQRINLQERQLVTEELDILARLFKEKKQYTASIRYLKYLSTLTPNLPMDLILSFPIRELGTYQLDFIEKIKTQKSICQSQTSSRAPLHSELSEANSVSNFSRKSEERPESKGRLRKIFASSPSKSIDSGSGVRIEDINRITNLKSYFWDKTNPLYYQL